MNLCAWVATVAAVAIAGCTSAPAGFTADDLAGHYRMQSGIDTWDELTVERDGRCTWWTVRTVGGLRRSASTGTWRRDGPRFVVALEQRAWDGPRARIELWPRRWRGHVYLVPWGHLTWFDRHGADEEFCFHAAGAPLAEPPPYLRDAQEPPR